MGRRVRTNGAVSAARIYRMVFPAWLPEASGNLKRRSMATEDTRARFGDASGALRRALAL